MLLLRFKAMEKSVDNCPHPQQVGDAGQSVCGAGDTVVRAV